MNPDYTVEDIRLIKTANDIQLFSFKIRNIGNILITTMNISLEGDNGILNITSDGIDPEFNTTRPLNPDETSSYLSIINSVSFIENYKLNVS